MDRRLLFLETLNDTDRRVNEQRSEYEALMIALPLRKLLLDGTQSLMILANREHRLKILFTHHVDEPPPLPQPDFWSMQDGLDPDTTPRAPAHAVESKLDQFLGTVILIVNTEKYTVKDAIDHVAYVVGAVHAGSPGDARQEQLAAVANSFRLDGLDPVTRSLRAVGRVTLKAVAALRDAVESDLKSA